MYRTDAGYRQAGVVEARESVKQGEESLRQGRSIMLFTIVTIIFLPLSFFTGVFGMNATNLTGSVGPGLYNWGDIFRFMSTSPPLS
jgi:Mg2+ and Co2+ transporter CorA